MYRYRLFDNGICMLRGPDSKCGFQNSQNWVPKLPCIALLTQPCVLWCSLGKSKSGLGESPARTGVPSPAVPAAASPLCACPPHKRPILPPGTKQWIVCCKQEWYETAFLQVQSFQKASWNNPWSLSGSSCGSRLEITKNSWNLKPETRIEITAPVKY